MPLVISYVPALPRVIVLVATDVPMPVSFSDPLTLSAEPDFLPLTYTVSLAPLDFVVNLMLPLLSILRQLLRVEPLTFAVPLSVEIDPAAVKYELDNPFEGLNIYFVVVEAAVVDAAFVVAAVVEAAFVVVVEEDDEPPTASNLNCWQAYPLYVHCWMLPPSAVDQPLTSTAFVSPLHFVRRQYTPSAAFTSLNVCASAPFA